MKALFSIALCFVVGWLHAHDRFILPSHTVLSGESAEISLIGSVSNDPFHPDMPFGDNGSGNAPESLRGFFKSLNPIIVHPDGKIQKDNIWQAFSRFSSGDLVLAKPGTYRIAQVQEGRYQTFFKHADGKGGRIAGKNPKLPEGATDVVTRVYTSRVETFVSLNAPTNEAVMPTGVGLELGPGTHPNDLFVGESCAFSLRQDGAELSGKVKVTFVRGGTRHRDQRAPLVIETDERGSFQVIFEEAGFYLMKAEAVQPAKPDDDHNSKNATLYVTLEVFN